MSKSDEARQRYIAEYDRFAEAARQMEPLLDGICRSLGVRADVEVRAKRVGSFVKKIHLKKYEDPWEQITDKVGARVITSTLDDRDRVRSAFASGAPPLPVVGPIVDKAAEADPGTLYYPGIHIQVVIPDALTDDGEAMQCEIQLRTKAQDLWSVPSHELVYKGVIEPSRGTKRRVLRLSVLTEMFDEEVRRAMTEIAADPRYAHAVLLRASEALYLTFVGDPGEDELSLEVLGIIGTTIQPEEWEAYVDALGRFAAEQHDKLADTYERFGIYSEFAEEPGYWLFSQPESLIVFERIGTRPQSLAAAVTGTEIEEPVRRLFAAWGAAMPDA